MASRPRISRQRWSEAFKKRVVAEASQPGVTVAQIARRYDLEGRRISNWIEKFCSGAALVPVEVTMDDGGSGRLRGHVCLMDTDAFTYCCAVKGGMLTGDTHHVQTAIRQDDIV